MALTSSTLKALIISETVAEFGSAGTEPNVSTPADALDRYAKSLAKAVVKWIDANGTGSVTGISGATGNLVATDNL